jgi:hypothetical protein
MEEKEGINVIKGRGRREKRRVEMKEENRKEKGGMADKKRKENGMKIRDGKRITKRIN